MSIIKWTFWWSWYFFQWYCYNNKAMIKTVMHFVVQIVILLVKFCLIKTNLAKDFWDNVKVRLLFFMQLCVKTDLLRYMTLWIRSLAQDFSLWGYAMMYAICEVHNGHRSIASGERRVTFTLCYIVVCM